MELAWCWMALLMLGNKIVENSATTTDVQEYCIRESFTPVCRLGEVIRVDEASFGRMRVGRCISGEGYTGCERPVQPFLEGWCSGRQECSVPVRAVSDSFVEPPCHKDYTNYLQVKHTCVPVLLATEDTCMASQFEIHKDNGVLASPSLSATVYGTVECPWVLIVSKGQYIELRLSVFEKPDVKTAKESGDNAQCAHTSFMTIEDRDETHKEPLCGGHRKEDQIYVSKSNTLTVYFTGFTSDMAFLVHFNVRGCPDQVASGHAHMKRTGDELEVRCNATGKTWYLTCEDGKWIGEIATCDWAGTAAKVSHGLGMPVPFAQGLTIAIVLGLLLGFIIGFTALGVVYLYRKRLQYDYSTASMTYTPKVVDSAIEESTIATTSPLYNRNELSSHVTRMPASTTSASLAPPPPPPPPSSSMRKALAYESPQFTDPSNRSRCELYFELDQQHRPPGRLSM